MSLLNPLRLIIASFLITASNIVSPNVSVGPTKVSNQEQVITPTVSSVLQPSLAPTSTPRPTLKPKATNNCSRFNEGLFRETFLKAGIPEKLIDSKIAQIKSRGCVPSTSSKVRVDTFNIDQAQQETQRKLNNVTDCQKQTQEYAECIKSNSRKQQEYLTCLNSYFNKYCSKPYEEYCHKPVCY